MAVPAGSVAVVVVVAAAAVARLNEVVEVAVASW